MIKKVSILLILFWIVSCNKSKLAAPSTFFIRPTAITVSPTSTIQGSGSHKITDLWYYTDGLFKGAYPLGSQWPVTEGSATIKVFAGIKNNGISETRQPYEFYEPVEIDTSVAPSTIVSRSFAFKYKSAAVFHYTESFSSQTTGLKTSAGSDIYKFQVLNNASDQLDGGYMYFSLEEDSLNGFFESVSQFSLPANGAPVYLELNYKCDQPFEVGVCNGSDYRSAVTINKSADWNKIYVQLSAGVSAAPVYTKYGICIRATRPAGSPKAEFFIDNLKLVSY